MEITYDPKFNIAYIKIKEKTEEVETIKISDEINIDISPNGKIYGIELLNANEQLQLLKGAKFTFIDESTGETIQIPIEI